MHYLVGNVELTQENASVIHDCFTHRKLKHTRIRGILEKIDYCTNRYRTEAKYS